MERSDREARVVEHIQGKNDSPNPRCSSATRHIIGATGSAHLDSEVTAFLILFAVQDRPCAYVSGLRTGGEASHGSDRASTAVQTSHGVFGPTLAPVTLAKRGAGPA